MNLKKHIVDKKKKLQAARGTQRLWPKLKKHIDRQTNGQTDKFSDLYKIDSILKTKWREQKHGWLGLDCTIKLALSL